MRILGYIGSIVISACGLGLMAWGGITYADTASDGHHPHEALATVLCLAGILLFVAGGNLWRRLRGDEFRY